MLWALANMSLLTNVDWWVGETVLNLEENGVFLVLKQPHKKADPKICI
jgi:hypothetical protein